jgi:hypothetical protein
MVKGPPNELAHGPKRLWKGPDSTHLFYRGIGFLTLNISKDSLGLYQDKYVRVYTLHM